MAGTIMFHLRTWDDPAFVFPCKHSVSCFCVPASRAQWEEKRNVLWCLLGRVRGIQGTDLKIGTKQRTWAGEVYLLLISVGNRCVLQICSKILLTHGIFPSCLECSLITNNQGGFPFKSCLQDRLSFYICLDSTSG